MHTAPARLGRPGAGAGAASPHVTCTARAGREKITPLQSRGAEQHRPLPRHTAAQEEAAPGAEASGAQGSLRSRCWDSRLVTRTAPEGSRVVEPAAHCRALVEPGIWCYELSPTSTIPCPAPSPGPGRAGMHGPGGEKGPWGCLVPICAAGSWDPIPARLEGCVAAPLCSSSLLPHHCPRSPWSHSSLCPAAPQHGAVPGLRGL